MTPVRTTRPLALLLTSALVALAPAAAALAGPDGTGVCVDELYQPDYSECWGVVTGCGNGTGTGVGHWYNNLATGHSHAWCYLYVQTGDGDFAAVCSETESYDTICVHVEQV